jgi:glycosyltransferase involved in cell wall biosynthesis
MALEDSHDLGSYSKALKSLIKRVDARTVCRYVFTGVRQPTAFGGVVRIAYLALCCPRHIHSFSGTSHFCLEALKRHFDVLDISDRAFDCTLNVIESVLRPTRIYPGSEPLAGAAFAWSKRRILKEFKPDAIFSLNRPWLLPNLLDSVPVIYCSDSTQKSLLDYYPEVCGIFGARSRRHCVRIERAVMDTARACIFSSKWAANSAVHQYGVSNNRIYVVPFGANLETLPDHDAFALRGTPGVCRLLFVGVNWTRKRGDLAVAVLDKLAALGIDAQLDVVGAEPPAPSHRKNVIFHGELDKNNKDDVAKLEKLYENAAFLLVPSKQEAFGIVFCEASAFGVPSLTTDTGGISDAVENGVNGFTLDLAAGAEPYASLIKEYWSSPSRYLELRNTTRQRSAKLLTWAKWGERVSEIVHGVMSQSPPGRDSHAAHRSQKSFAL